MTGAQNAASEKAYNQFSAASQKYYDVALPAMQKKQDSATAALAQGESPVMGEAFQAQRAGLTEGMMQQQGDQNSQTMRASKSALSGGNSFSQLHPAEIGAKLANALWGSKYQEGQSDIEQRLGLMSSIMGGSAQAGNAGMQAAGNELGAIQNLPGYNQTYANVVGAASIGASVYGGMNQAGLFNRSQPPPPVTSVPTWANPAQPGSGGIA